MGNKEIYDSSSLVGWKWIWYTINIKEELIFIINIDYLASENK